MVLKFLCLALLVAWVGASSLEPSGRDYELMRELGQNPRTGPNLIGHSGPFHQRHERSQESSEGSTRALEDYLLPTGIRPLHYTVELIPYLLETPGREFTFDGKVDIKIFVEKPTSSIVLHAFDLSNFQVEVTQTNTGAVQPLINWSLATDDRQFFTLNLASTLVSGQEYNIKVNFTGNLNTDGFGFFRSQYTDENGNTDWLATTQFESTGARQSFPCFDEPALKATFSIILAQAPGYTAVANMPVETVYDSPELPAGWNFAKFQDSPVMSSYLVAYTTSKFGRLESTKDSRFAVWARPSELQYGAYSNDISPDHFNYYQTYTQTNYGLPKVDQLAYQDFFSGAMENWGHISYVERLLLWNPATGSQGSKQLVTQVVSHELTHQWFGDIVSPTWWNDLWLNEGFATYFEFFATGDLNPTWNMDQQFQVDNMYDAFAADEFFLTSHPVHANVDSPNSIDSIFDYMSYNKGGCLVRFMINLMGPENFRSGIFDYMRNHAYSAAHQDDLFAALAPHVPAGVLPNGVTFAQVMNSLTLQEGVPAVTVTRDYATQTAQVTQKRFSINGPEQWPIPLTLTSQAELNFDSQTPASWLLTDSQELGAAEGIPLDNQWVLLNIKQTGYFRVNYDQANWDMLFAFLNDPQTADLIDPLNRAQILDDSLAFGVTGLLDYKTALSSTLYLHHETQYGPWAAALRRLEFIRDRMYQTAESKSLFNKYVSAKLENIFNSVNGLYPESEESHITGVTRTLVSRWACNTGLEACNHQGQALARQWKQTDAQNPINPDIRATSYCAGMRQGTLDDYNFYISQYLSAETAEDRTQLLGALGCASDIALLEHFLYEILPTASYIKEGDALGVFFSVYSNPIGTDLALDFLIQNFAVLKNKMNIGFAFAAISEKLNTQTHYEKIQLFLDDHRLELSQQEQNNIEGALSQLTAILEWNAAHLGEVMLFFVQNQL
ncbi:aminopeptidase Ey-like [Neocloeon triangulifer]|uniref:aminopeptidase Ey-like n=1 Tax=Neocloeon triangulifer TaxID=2078957 RepID=UPI00286F1C9B|nr:aminopeptidase Ey-like [Neocloeon triangulifer]